LCIGQDIRRDSGLAQFWYIFRCDLNRRRAAAPVEQPDICAKPFCSFRETRNWGLAVEAAQQRRFNLPATVARQFAAEQHRGCSLNDLGMSKKQVGMGVSPAFSVEPLT
jgi:hypothetical protein